MTTNHRDDAPETPASKPVTTPPIRPLLSVPRPDPIQRKPICETRPWSWQPAPGDVVRFGFPEQGGRRGKRGRPCLVAAVDLVSGEVVVVYGTKQWPWGPDDNDIEVKTEAGMRACGLEYPTLFRATRMLRVSLDDPRFVIGGNGTPRIGHLPRGLAKDLRGLPIGAAAIPRSGVGQRRRAVSTCPLPAL